MTRVSSFTPDPAWLETLIDTKIAAASGSGGITDGDKGDIVVSGSGVVWTIDTSVVTTAKMGGDVTAAGKALLDDADAAAQRTTLGLATVAASGSAADLTGNLSVSRLNSGTGATSGTFWRGDGTWAAAAGGGTVTDVSVVTANGVSGSVATSTSTPAITLTLGAITPSSVAASGTVTGSNLSGTNTGDQTSVSGNAGTATTLQTARNFSISGGGITAAAVSFDGSAAVVLSASVDASHITLARMADVATSTVFYRKTAGTGAPEVNTLATLKTDLGLTGTNSGDQTSIVGITGTKAQFDTAVTDGNILYVGDVTQYTDEAAQDAVGAMVDASLTYVDATPLLQRAALTGAVTASAGSNATLLGSFTTAQLNTALSDNDVATGGGTATGANTGDQTITLTGDVTGTGTGSFAATIQAGAVTLAKQADMATASVVYRKTAGTGVPEVQTLATLKTDLGLTGTNAGDYAYVTTSANYVETATAGEKVVDVTASGVRIDLPTAVGNTAKLTYKLMVDGTLDIDANGFETIDGGGVATLLSQYEAVTLVSTGAAWRVI